MSVQIELLKASALAQITSDLQAAVATSATNAANSATQAAAVANKADMTRVSATSNTISIGQKTFAYAQSLNLGWAVGTRLRASSTALPAAVYMEGVISSVSSTSVNIEVDMIAGSGTTLSSWNIGISGQTGTNGTNGTNGKSWRTGAYVPTAGNESVRTDGILDNFLQTDTGDLFRQLGSGSWQSIGNIKGPTGSTGPQGQTGATGANGTNGNAVLNGTVNPSVGTGVNGDFYINTAANTLFGPKAGGAWPAGVSLVGPAGSGGGGSGSIWYNGSGAPSAGTGVNGDYYINTANSDVYLKSSGSWGVLMNIKGATGATGTTGATGATGATGTNGTNGTNGSTWYNGSGVPSVGTGVNGDYYLNTANSDIYLKASGTWSILLNIKGATGATGTTGTTGAAGTNGTNGTNGNTVLNGTVNPSVGTGVNGDFYINTAANTLFGPKAGGAWPAGVSLVGPAGATGATGSGGGGSTTVSNNLTTTATGTALDAAQGVKLRRAARNAPILVAGGFNAPHQGFSSGTETSRTYSYSFTPVVNCTGLQFSFANWSLGVDGAPAEVWGQNDITVKAGVSVGGLTRYITFAGANSDVISPGATIESDPFPYLFAAGTAYTIRVNVQCATSGKWPLANYCVNTVAGDASLTGTISGASTTGYCPFMVRGVPLSAPTKQSIAMVGDSLFVGNNGETQDQGWLRRGLDAQGIAWSRFCISSMSLASHIGANGTFLLTHVTKHEVIITDIGGAEAQGWANLAAAQAALLPAWQRLAANGSEVYACTLTPLGGSVAAQIALRAAVNDWIRTIPAPLTGFVDVG